MRIVAVEGTLAGAEVYVDDSGDVTIATAPVGQTQVVDVPHAAAIAAGRYLTQRARLVLEIDCEGDDVVRAEILRLIAEWLREPGAPVARSPFAARMRAMVGAS